MHGPRLHSPGARQTHPLPDHPPRATRRLWSAQARGTGARAGARRRHPAAWLGGSRWAVLAPADNAVAIADFGAKALTPLGGRSSKALRNPSNLFVSGDTLYVGDWALRRLTLWTPSGRLVRSIPAANAVRGTLPRARDRAGYFYLDLYPLPGPDGSGNRDSAAVVRLDTSFVRGGSRRSTSQ